MQCSWWSIHRSHDTGKMVRSNSGVFKPVEVGSFMPFIYRVFEHKFQKVVGIPWDFWLPSTGKNRDFSITLPISIKLKAQMCTSQMRALSCTN